MTSTDLRADCTRCRALCCVVLPFTRSADFAFDKRAGDACRHLEADHRCRIHDRLLTAGFRGCATFDCFGAGQRASTLPNAGEAFAALRVLHELLFYLRCARGWASAEPLHPDIDGAIEQTETAADRVGDGAQPDVYEHRNAVAALLRRASDLVRGPGAPDRSQADLAGRDLRRLDLTRTSLRGAVLIGADLRGADLRRTDLLGADLRNADLRGADVSTALYLTQTQANSVRGDERTRLPRGMLRPGHWPQ